MYQNRQGMLALPPQVQLIEKKKAPNQLASLIGWIPLVS
jgi:hypothetical protein